MIRGGLGKEPCPVVKCRVATMTVSVRGAGTDSANGVYYKKTGSDGEDKPSFVKRGAGIRWWQPHRVWYLRDDMHAASVGNGHSYCTF